MVQEACEFQSIVSLKHYWFYCLNPDGRYLNLQIAKLRYVMQEDVSDSLYALSCEPDLRVRIFSGCLVDGVRYHTADREKYRTQNSGVMAEGTHDGESIEFYGCLKQIIELQYNSSEWITPLQWFFFVVTGLILTARNVE